MIDNLSFRAPLLLCRGLSVLALRPRYILRLNWCVPSWWCWCVPGRPQIALLALPSRSAGMAEGFDQHIVLQYPGSGYKTDSLIPCMQCSISRGTALPDHALFPSRRTTLLRRFAIQTTPTMTTSIPSSAPAWARDIVGTVMLGCASTCRGP